MYEPFKAGKVYRMRHKNAWATFLMNDELMANIEPGALVQLRNAMEAPGLDSVVITPDVHYGYSVPIGCTMVSQTHLYPDVVGPDPGCSVALSYLGKLDPEYMSNQATTILQDVQKVVKAGREDNPNDSMSQGEFFRILQGEYRPQESWLAVHDVPPVLLYSDLSDLVDEVLTDKMLSQRSTIGGGNHFWEINIDSEGNYYLLTHFGSRGIGAALAKKFDQLIGAELEKWGVHVTKDTLLYIPEDTLLGQMYFDFQTMMLEWATYNHNRVHQRTWDILSEHLDFSPEFMGHVPHNFIEKREDGTYIGRKGATPSDYYPLLVPGSMSTGSYVLREGEESSKLGRSVSHGAGRVLSRGQAKRELSQEEANFLFEEAGVVGNFTDVPLDESQDAYKDVDSVISSLVECGAAEVGFKLFPRLVMKGTE